MSVNVSQRVYDDLQAQRNSYHATVVAAAAQAENAANDRDLYIQLRDELDDVLADLNVV